jgi:hypothetical protein
VPADDGRPERVRLVLGRRLTTVKGEILNPAK